MEILKVAANVWIPKANILFVEEKKGNPLAAQLKLLETKKMLHNRCGRKKQLSVIHLVNGEAIISPISVKTLRKWYEKGNSGCGGESYTEEETDE